MILPQKYNFLFFSKDKESEDGTVNGTFTKDTFILSCAHANECTEEGCTAWDYDKSPAHGYEKSDKRRTCCCKGDR